MDIANWKKMFLQILKMVCDYYRIDEEDIASRGPEKKDQKYDITTVRKWMNGDRFPNKKSQKDLMSFVCEQIITSKSSKNISYQFSFIYKKVEGICADFSLKDIRDFAQASNEDIPTFVSTVLNYCIAGIRQEEAAAKAGIHHAEEPCNEKTKAVIFDFDGTLTEGHANRTTWEDIWTKLGYDVEECRFYHELFDRKSITHEAWCKITENRFKQRGMNEQILKEIAKEITLMPGIQEVLDLLSSHSIKLYIVSGSIYSVICDALGPLFEKFDGIKANLFDFNEDETLQRIVGTKYDFEGKATYITELSEKLHIHPSSILFVGNSLNDKYAHISGAKTLCINPQNTDVSDKIVWNNCLESCSNLNEIIPFINL